MELSPFLYGLYKVAKYAVYPYTWLATLVCIIMILSRFPSSPRTTRWIRLTALTAFFILFILGNSFVSTTLLGILEAWHPPKEPTVLSKSDFIVVLGGGVAEKGSLRPTTELTPLNMQRVLCGTDLYSHGLAPTIVMSGGDSSVIGEGAREAEYMKQFAMSIGVPANAIVVETRSRTTYENAVEVRRLLGDRASIILVTNAYHMPRAYRFFARQGLSSTPYPCGFLTRNGPGLTGTWNPLSMIPNAGAFWQNSLAISEFVGIAVYSLAGSG